VVSVSNSYLDLDLDTGGGVVSRVRLPMGTNTNLPLSTRPTVTGAGTRCAPHATATSPARIPCASANGTGIGVVSTTLVDGPLMKVIELTSQRVPRPIG